MTAGALHFEQAAYWVTVCVQRSEHTFVDFFRNLFSDSRGSGGGADWFDESGRGYALRLMNEEHTRSQRQMDNLFLTVALPAELLAPKVIVIGQTMERVIPFSDRIGARYYTPWRFAAKANWMRNNMAWLDRSMDQGATIIDIGRDVYKSSLSRYYEAEIARVQARGYPYIMVR